MEKDLTFNSFCFFFAFVDFSSIFLRIFLYFSILGSLDRVGDIEVEQLNATPRVEEVDGLGAEELGRSKKKREGRKE